MNLDQKDSIVDRLNVGDYIPNSNKVYAVQFFERPVYKGVNTITSTTSSGSIIADDETYSLMSTPTVSGGRLDES